MPCSQLQLNQRFGGHIASTFRVKEEAEQATKMKAGGKHSCSFACQLLSCWFLA
jgi:hypothetical protein